MRHGDLPAPEPEQMLEPDPEVFLAGGPLKPDECDCEALCECDKVTVDREQIRRERIRLTKASELAEAGNYGGACNLFALEVGELLAELEQAERERDQWADRFDRQYTLAEAHEARLAKVSDLVEAAKDLYELVEMAESVGVCLSDRVPSLRLGQALAAWEQGG